MSSPVQQWSESGLNFPGPLCSLPRGPGERAGLLTSAKSDLNPKQVILTHAVTQHVRPPPEPGSSVRGHSVLFDVIE